MGLTDERHDEYLINHYSESVKGLLSLLRDPDLSWEHTNKIRNLLKGSVLECETRIKSALEAKGYGIPDFEAGRQYILHNEDLDETVVARFERVVTGVQHPDTMLAYLFRKKLEREDESALVLVRDEEFLRGNVYIVPTTGA